MSLRPVLLASLLALPALGGGPEWPAIPAEVWSIKAEGPYASGAVVLQDSLKLHSRSMDHFRRILVLSEPGRDAASATALVGKVKDLRGRTVAPDGKVSAFEDAKDFVHKDGARVGRLRVKTHVLIPPGVTDHCIVDLSWSEPVDDLRRPIPSRYGYSFEWLLASYFPTRMAEVWIDKNALPADWNFRFEAGPAIKSETLHTGESDGYLFRDIPARGDLPFAREIDQGLPRFFYFWTPDLSPELSNLYGLGAQMPTTTFWDGVCQAFYSEAIDGDTKRSKGFEAFWVELRKDLPADGPGKARELLRRLKQRIRNTDELSIQEEGDITDDQLRKSTLKAQNLDDAISRGSTNDFGMVLLYFHLLKREGFQPMLGLVVNPSHGHFHPEQSNLFQFDDALVGIQDGKGVLWGDPASRHLELGTIPFPYQGEVILSVQTDPDAKKWKPSMVRMPVQGGDMNLRDYQVRFLGGGRAFKVQAAFKGYSAVEEKARFERHDTAAQVKILKESVEPGLGDAVIDKAEVHGAREIAEPITWSLEGHIETEGTQHLDLHPFAMIPAPFAFPASWPDSRDVALSLPDLSRHEATAVIELPPGTQASAVEPLHRANRFGKVDLSGELHPGAAGGQELALKLTVEPLALRTGPDRYAELREFVGWVQEALRLKVQLTTSTK